MVLTNKQKLLDYEMLKKDYTKVTTTNAKLVDLIRDMLSDNDCKVHGGFFHRAVALITAKENDDGQA